MLLVLALIWGGFLVWWLRSRAQGTFGDSVGTFRRHLYVIERAAPTTVRPANRLRGPQMVPAYRPPGGVSTATPRSAGGGSRAATGAARGGAPPVRGGAGPARRPAIAADHQRRQALKRRRDVLFLLTVAVVASLVMAAATRAGALIGFQVVADVALAGYVALLVRLRSLAAERSVKLAYLPERSSRRYQQDHTGEMAARRAPHRRAQPTNGSYVGYGSYGSYGDLAVRHAAT